MGDTVSERTVNAIKAYQAAGGSFVVCSGQNWDMARKFARATYDAKVPYAILDNGNSVYQIESGKKVWANEQDNVPVITMMNALHAAIPGLEWHIYCGNKAGVSSRSSMK